MHLLNTDLPSPIDVLHIDGLYKRFGPLRVLEGVDCVIRPGESVAIVGPNGAGKTTLIKCILGLVRPDEGCIRVLGHDTTEGVDWRKVIGYMPQDPCYPDNLTGRDILELIRTVRPDTRVSDRSLGRGLGLESDLDKPFRTLSGGTRQKISAVAAFQFEPPILMLDEPTAGLDPIASTTLKEHIRHASATGSAVILTSHVMADLEELCDRVVFLLDGRIRFDGSMDAIRSRTGEQKLERAIARLLEDRAA